MSYFGGPDKLVKQFRGCFDYYRGNELYCEENFDVLYHPQSQYYQFDSKIIGRVKTGEMLSINVVYEITDKFIPRMAYVSKTLGNQSSTELFTFDQKTSTLNYEFKGVDSEGSAQLNTNYKFHISLPSAVTSMLFMKTRKFNNTSKNNYSVLSSYNQWSFEKGPEFQGLSLERIGANKDQLTIGDSKIQSFKYKLCKESLDAASTMMSNKRQEKKAYLLVYISGHLTIPYKIVTTSDRAEEMRAEQSRIMIRYLNDLRESN
ncbi:MAG: hypothetical protein OEY33_01635 [Bdellovibrionales bacterium]|nr:hypothetical protein [Bdellovibrionales bacterium]